MAQGIAAALYDSFYDTRPLSPLPEDYLVPTAMESTVEILTWRRLRLHIDGAKGVGGASHGWPPAPSPARGRRPLALAARRPAPHNPDSTRPRSETHERAKGTVQNIHHVRIP